MTVVSGNMSVLLFLAIFPIIIILLFVYYNDKNKEPFFLLLRLFLSGFISCGIVLFVSGHLETFASVFSPTSSKNIYQTFIYSFVGVALVEEISKWFMVYAIGYHNKSFDEVYDGLVYAVFVSLGFAFIENILYVLISNSISTAIVRALCAVPSHACDAIFMGHHLSLAKQYAMKGNKRKERQQLLLSIIMPAFIHGVYDFCLLSGFKILIIVFAAFIVFMYFISISTLKDMSLSNNQIRNQKHKYCKNCGQLINQQEICPRCNARQIPDKKILSKWKVGKNKG